MYRVNVQCNDTGLRKTRNHFATTTISTTFSQNHKWLFILSFICLIYSCLIILICVSKHLLSRNKLPVACHLFHGIHASILCFPPGTFAMEPKLWWWMLHKKTLLIYYIDSLSVSSNISCYLLEYSYAHANANMYVETIFGFYVLLT